MQWRQLDLAARGIDKLSCASLIWGLLQGRQEGRKGGGVGDG